MASIQDKRFKNERYWMGEFVKQITRVSEELPPYRADTRERDRAMQNFVRSESLLSGVVASAVSRDKNRGWTLTGSARQVAYYSKRLHASHNGLGWRQFVSLNANEWYTTNLGYASEIGFRYKDGPAETMWNLDSTRCRLTSIPETPLFYHPGQGKVPLARNEYIHGNSMPSFEEGFNYAGMSAVERALSFTRLMIGVNQHQLEKLGVVMAKGILHGTGIERKEYEQAVRQFNEDKLNNGTASTPGVMGLFTKNAAAKLNLIGLSQLPDNFDLKEFVDILMQAYALSFGFPVGEFWSIASGSFGRTGEMNIQQEQAYAKGEMDFALSFQEQLQTYFLPPAVSFNFESRNDKGYALKAAIDKEKATMYKEMFEAKQQQITIDPETGIAVNGFVNIIDRDEARQLYADAGLIPSTWTVDADGMEEISDLQEAREVMLSNAATVQYMKRNPEMPMVVYRWSDELDRSLYPIFDNLDDYIFPAGSVKVLWRQASDAFKKYYTVTKGK